MTRTLDHATRTPTAKLLVAIPLLLAACHSPPPHAPGDLPRGSYLGSASPMTSREASREPARARSPIAESAQPRPDDAGIDVPWNSTAARMNWRPIETSEPDDKPTPNDDSNNNDNDSNSNSNSNNDNDKQDDNSDTPSSDENPNKDETKDKTKDKSESKTRDNVPPTGNTDAGKPSR